jgi:hypothetical protein
MVEAVVMTAAPAAVALRRALDDRSPLAVVPQYLSATDI